MLLLPGVNPDDKVAEDVHVVDECLVGSVVRDEARVYFAVGEELGGHVVQVVALRQVSEICP